MKPDRRVKKLARLKPETLARRLLAEQGFKQTAQRLLDQVDAELATANGRLAQVEELNRQNVRILEQQRDHWRQQAADARERIREWRETLGVAVAERQQMKKAMDLAIGLLAIYRQLARVMIETRARLAAEAQNQRCAAYWTERFPLLDLPTTISGPEPWPEPWWRRFWRW